MKKVSKKPSQFPNTVPRGKGPGRTFWATEEADPFHSITFLSNVKTVVAKIEQ